MYPLFTLDNIIRDHFRVKGFVLIEMVVADAMIKIQPL